MILSKKPEDLKNCPICAHPIHWESMVPQLRLSYGFVCPRCGHSQIWDLKEAIPDDPPRESQEA